MSGSFNVSVRQVGLLILLLWTLVGAWLLANTWDGIVKLDFRDPDDALRLVQIRDGLAGQSWFDVRQHRLLPPQGVPMHWSRLVDLPVAAAILALQPLFGAAMAERAAIVIVPLLELLALFCIVYHLSRTLALSRGTALLATALLGTSMSILIQFYPTRIDHHGMQILFGGLAMIALLRAPQGKSPVAALVSGLAMACWLQVSMEGLPAAVALGTAFAFRALWRREAQRDIATYLCGLTGGSAVLLFGTHRPADALLPWCDAMSPAYLVPLGAATLVLLMGQQIARRPTFAARLVPLALAGAAGAASFLALSRQCLAGPFATLDPLVYTTWYRSVLEGLPIYAQLPEIQLMIVLPVLLGLPGTIIGLRATPTEKLKDSWRCLLFMQVAAALLALDVMRAMSFAHLLSLPGNAVLLAALMRRAQRLRAMPPRVLLTAASVVLTPFGTVAATAAALVNSANAQASVDEVTASHCTHWDTTRGLAVLPATTLFTPLDIGSHLLAYTPHNIVATGHHRNRAGMTAVVHAFMAPQDEARAIVTATPARYLAICPGLPEVIKYRKKSPDGLAADLLAGHIPSWLEPVPMRPGEVIQVYRITRPAVAVRSPRI